MTEWMQANDVTQAELAAQLARVIGGKSGLNQSRISAWLSGKDIPRVPALVALVKHCAIPFGDWAIEVGKARRKRAS